MTTVQRGDSVAVTEVPRNTLDVTVADSGDIGYYGDPKVSKTIVGSGRIKRVGAFLQ